MATLAEQASKLLDFNQKLDITLLDNIVGCMYTGIGEQQRVAQEVLTTLKEHPNAWTRVDTILEYSQVILIMVYYNAHMYLWAYNEIIYISNKIIIIWWYKNDMFNNIYIYYSTLIKEVKFNLYRIIAI